MPRNLWVGCLLVVLLATACGGGKSVFSLAVGDHPASSDAPYPGGDALDDYGNGYCLSEFDNYVGIEYGDSRLAVAYFSPGREGWEDGDDREVSCFLYDLNHAKLTGSMKDSRE